MVKFINCNRFIKYPKKIYRLSANFENESIFIPANHSCEGYYTYPCADCLSVNIKTWISEISIKKWNSKSNFYA